MCIRDRRLSDWAGRYPPALICHVNKHIDSYHIKNPRDTVVYLPDVHVVRSSQSETFRAVAERFGISAKELIELNQAAYAPSDRCPSESAAWRNQLRGATADSVVPPETLRSSRCTPRSPSRSLSIGSRGCPRRASARATTT